MLSAMEKGNFMICLKRHLIYISVICGYCILQPAVVSSGEVTLQSLIDRSYNNLTSFKTQDKPPAPKIDPALDTIFITPSNTGAAAISRRDIGYAENIYELHAIIAYLTARKMIAHQKTKPEIDITPNEAEVDDLLVGVATLAALLVADKPYDKRHDRNSLDSLNRYPEQHVFSTRNEKIRVPLKRHDSQIDKLAITLLSRAGICPAHYKDILEKIYFSADPDSQITWQRLEEIDINIKPKAKCDEGYAELNRKFLKVKKNLFK